ncbi:E3 ubiquitin-protein ligase RNF13 [Trichinella nelsoni]|uniref:E3 ubiquitin-protein ligase RNF13 n=1 Tax=Trichinella nelsoni TaxID=6336 RepID=A0A0V0RLT6_9BILA|nr:E3 ubiquitin-protein ligase RNF13 [Trichinella nelsoni]
MIRKQTMGIVNTVLIALLLICEVFGEADDYIGCTSVVKLLNVKIDRRLHSHDVRYGSGSGQQSVTGIADKDDKGSYWVVLAAHDNICQRGQPIACNSVIRFQHSSTGCLLHSHSAFACPFSGNQEVSCFGKNGIGDEGDNWIVLCDKKYWEKGDEVQFKHLQTDHYLGMSSRKYDRPIVGQNEVCAFRSDSFPTTWKAKLTTRWKSLEQRRCVQSLQLEVSSHYDVQLVIIDFFIRNSKHNLQSANSTYTACFQFRSNETDVEFFDDCTASSATFGLAIVAEEVTMCTLAVEPILACGQLPPAPTHFNSTPFCISGYYAIARRGNCSFAKKAFNAQKAGYSGLFIYNDYDEVFPMAGDGIYEKKVTIPALMISRTCGLKLINDYPSKDGYGVLIRLWWSYNNALKFLIPLVAVIGVSFLILLSVVSFRWFRNQQRLQRRRLTRRQLKKIPNRKYKKGDEHEMCAICLEDFADGDKMRLLPCGHVYHCACVDPWLLKNRKVCPVCKRKVTDDSDDSDWDSADEQPAAPSEHSPLFSNLSSSRSSSAGDLQVGNSTFYTNYGSTGCGLCPYSFCRPRAEHDNGMLKQLAKKPSLFHINCSAEVTTVPVSSGGQQQQQQQQQHAVASTSSASTGVDNLSFVQDSTSISSVAADPSEPTASTSYPAPSSSSDPPTTTQLP